MLGYYLDCSSDDLTWPDKQSEGLPVRAAILGLSPESRRWTPLRAYAQL
jgi:hypothetical protein